jgi:hypothetical protein
MTINSPFIFKESFSGIALSKLHEELKISGTNDPELLLIVRLLSGALDLEHKYSGDLLKHKENYFSSDMKGYSNHWAKKLPKIIGEDYTADELAKYITATRYKNKDFYKNFLLELCNFVLYTKRKSHTSAFIYLYRALEKVSYSFPLIYISKTDDFLHTYTFLKELMQADKKLGELGFFKKFVKTFLYKDDPIIDSTVDFNISGVDSDLQNIFFKLLKEQCTDDMISGSTISPSILSINYKEVGSFIINIRNRFFHYMNGGQKNIDSDEIVDSDLLFSLVNKKCMYWLATVFLGVLSHNISEFDKT